MVPGCGESGTDATGRIYLEPSGDRQRYDVRLRLEVQVDNFDRRRRGVAKRS